MWKWQPSPRMRVVPSGRVDGKRCVSEYVWYQEDEGRARLWGSRHHNLNLKNSFLSSHLAHTSRSQIKRGQFCILGLKTAHF